VTVSAQMVRRALCAAATSAAAFAVSAVPAGAAQADKCPGALDIPTSEAGIDAANDAVLCLVNAERTSRGMKPLTRDRDLTQAARKHSADMVRRKFFAHENPSGKDFGDRIRGAGYGRPGDGWRVGEDLGWGTGSKATPNWIVDAWLNSPPHRKVLLDGGYREIGLGVVQGAPQDSSLPGATYTMDLGVIR